MMRLLVALVLIATPVAAQSLPDGAGRDIVKARCMTCHEADIIKEQRLTRTGWERSIDKMVRWGATVPSDQREPLVSYLAEHFRPTIGGGAEVPSSVLSGKASPSVPSDSVSPSTVGEAAFKRACLTCHERDIIEQQRLTRAGWVRGIGKMIGWGAVVPEAERDALADYLAWRFPAR